MNTQEQLRQAFEDLQRGTFLKASRPAGWYRYWGNGISERPD
jgi:hypothetical protein